MNSNIQDIVKQVRSSKSGRDEVIKDLYSNEKLRSLANQFIVRNSGTKEDAEDLVTEGVISFITQCYRKEFAISTDPINYILAIIRNKWISSRKKVQPMVDLEFVDRSDNVNFHHPEYLLIDSEKKDQFRRLIASLDSKCFEVLQLWSRDVRMRQIALSMNYKSEGMARKKKHECMQKLILLVENHKMK